jgi:hypothetical protein
LLACLSFSNARSTSFRPAISSLLQAIQVSLVILLHSLAVSAGDKDLFGGCSQIHFGHSLSQITAFLALAGQGKAFFLVKLDVGLCESRILATEGADKGIGQGLAELGGH